MKKEAIAFIGVWIIILFAVILLVLNHSIENYSGEHMVVTIEEIIPVNKGEYVIFAKVYPSGFEREFTTSEGKFLQKRKSYAVRVERIFPENYRIFKVLNEVDIGKMNY